MDPTAPIPVILDTDPGDDVDDTWAMVMLLNSPEVDVKMIVTSNGDTKKRAQIVAKLLTVANRTDVDVAIGRVTGAADGFMKAGPGSQYRWAENFDLEGYAGTVHKDGIAAMKNLIDSHDSSSEPPITILSIAPCHNVGDLVRRDPTVAEKCCYVGMQGSIKKIMRLEYNVAQDVEAARRVFAAGWKKMSITPLDTCGMVQIEGDQYASVVAASEEEEKPLLRAMMELNELWATGMPGVVRARTLREEPSNPKSPLVRSSTLFDCAAVYLAFSTEYFEMEDKCVTIDPLGRTKVTEGEGNRVSCALAWRDFEAFCRLMVQRVTAS